MKLRTREVETIEPAPGAVALVDEIRDEALSLNWDERRLYSTKGRYRFPCGESWGLVCFLRSGDRIGKITERYIVIERSDGARSRFYNPGTKQPWHRQRKPMKIGPTLWPKSVEESVARYVAAVKEAKERGRRGRHKGKAATGRRA